MRIKGDWKWPQSDADWPRLLPKWPFDPVLIQGTLPDDQKRSRKPMPGRTIYPNQAIPTIEGAVVQYLSFRNRGFEPTKDRPFAGFPHDWNAVRITTGKIADRMELEVRYAHSRNYFRNLSDEEYASKVAEAQAALRYWSDRGDSGRALRRSTSRARSVLVVGRQERLAH